MPSSTELIEMAHTEWKNREERRELHDEVSWESGWISGYLSRPHTPAPFPTKEQLKELSDSECFWEKGEAIQKHDDAIARAATLAADKEHVRDLELIVSLCKTLRHHYPNDISLEMTQTHHEREIKRIESLRSTAGDEQE